MYTISELSSMSDVFLEAALRKDGYTQDPKDPDRWTHPDNLIEVRIQNFSPVINLTDAGYLQMQRFRNAVLNSVYPENERNSRFIDSEQISREAALDLLTVMQNENRRYTSLRELDLLTTSHNLRPQVVRFYPPSKVFEVPKQQGGHDNYRYEDGELVGFDYATRQYTKEDAPKDLTAEYITYNGIPVVHIFNTKTEKQLVYNEFPHSINRLNLLKAKAIQADRDYEKLLDDMALSKDIAYPLLRTFSDPNQKDVVLTNMDSKYFDGNMLLAINPSNQQHTHLTDQDQLKIVKNVMEQAVIGYTLYLAGIEPLYAGRNESIGHELFECGKQRQFYAIQELAFRGYLRLNGQEHELTAGNDEVINKLWDDFNKQARWEDMPYNFDYANDTQAFVNVFLACSDSVMSQRYYEHEGHADKQAGYLKSILESGNETRPLITRCNHQYFESGFEEALMNHADVLRPYIDLPGKRVYDRFLELGNRTHQPPTKDLLNLARAEIILEDRNPALFEKLAPVLDKLAGSTSFYESQMYCKRYDIDQICLNLDEKTQLPEFARYIEEEKPDTAMLYATLMLDMKKLTKDLQNMQTSQKDLVFASSYVKDRLSQIQKNLVPETIDPEYDSSQRFDPMAGLSDHTQLEVYKLIKNLETIDAQNEHNMKFLLQNVQQNLEKPTDGISNIIDHLLNTPVGETHFTNKEFIEYLVGSSATAQLDGENINQQTYLLQTKDAAVELLTEMAKQSDTYGINLMDQAEYDAANMQIKISCMHLDETDRQLTDAIKYFNESAINIPIPLIPGEHDNPAFHENSYVYSMDFENKKVTIYEVANDLFDGVHPTDCVGELDPKFHKDLIDAVKATPEYKELMEDVRFMMDHTPSECVEHNNNKRIEQLRDYLENDCHLPKQVLDNFELSDGYITPSNEFDTMVTVTLTSKTDDKESLTINFDPDYMTDPRYVQISHGSSDQPEMEELGSMIEDAVRGGYSPDLTKYVQNELDIRYGHLSPEALVDIQHEQSALSEKLKTGISHDAPFDDRAAEIARDYFDTLNDHASNGGSHLLAEHTEAAAKEIVSKLQDSFKAQERGEIVKNDHSDRV